MVYLLSLIHILFVEAEKTFRASKQGQQKFDYVIRLARSMLPKPIQLFVRDKMLKEIVQLWFDGVKDVSYTHLDVYKRQMLLLRQKLVLLFL